MRKVIYITLCLSALLIAGCDRAPQIYSYNEVEKDSTDVWTLRKNGKKVNGIVERHTKHFLLNRPCVQRIDVVGGIDVGFKDYIDDECIGSAEYADNGETGTYYGEQGYNTYTVALKDGIPDGICEVFDSDGKQIREIVFEKGELVKTYEFDSEGDKIIPIEERLELVAYDTGFYESVNYNRNEVLYCPIVIMKFKNISDSPIKDGYDKINATFLSENEVWDSGFTYLIGLGDPPMSPGIMRQFHIESSVGYLSYNAIGNANIVCQLFINDKPFKTIRVENKVVRTNRIQ